VAAYFEPLPVPGQELRWRHPRRASALGWFHVYGPGPFPFLGVIERPGEETSQDFLIQTEFGAQVIDPHWVGPSEPSNGRRAAGENAQ
jgi:hypothetical protein